MQPTVLFSCTEFDGLHSAKHPLALGAGMAYDLKNSRKDVGGAIRVREGVSTAVAAATGLPAGSFKGASPFYDDGTYVHQVVAWKEADNDVHLYHRKYTISTTTWGSWTLVTQDSGKYGDTALTDPANGRIAFYWCEVPGGSHSSVSGFVYRTQDSSLLMASDGTNVRALDMGVIVNGPEAGDGSQKYASHANPIPPPKGHIGVEFDAYDWLDIINGAVTVTGNGSGDWGGGGGSGSVSQQGSSGSYTWRWVTNATISGSSAADITFSTEEITYATYVADQDYFQPKHVILVAHATKDDFWENVTIGFKWKKSGGAYAFKDFDTAPLVLSTNTSSYEMVVIPLPDQLPEQAADLLMNGLRFTTKASTPVSCTVTVYAMGVGGVVPGGTEYGICRRNRGGHVFSPGVVLHNTAFGTKNASSRAANTGVLDGTTRKDFNGVPSTTVHLHSTLPDGFILPIDSRVCYTPKVRYSEPHQGELDDNAADYIVVYRKEPSDADYYRVTRILTGYYTGGAWTDDGGGAADSTTETYTDIRASYDRNYKDRLPDESCVPPPPFLAARTIGSRTYLLENTTQGCTLRISEHGQPTRFVDGVAVSDDTKGGFNLKISNAKGRAVSQTEYVGGSAESAQAIVFTDEDAWSPFRMQGDVVLYDLRRVSSFGSCGPSVTESDGHLCWVDRDMDVRVLGREGSLSRYRVSDKLTAVPAAYTSITDVAFWKGRIYISYTTSGQTENKQVLVYNVDGDYWEGYDAFPSGKEPQQFFSWRTGGANLLYFIASDGAIYEYEKSGQVTDAGTGIAFLIESGEYHNDFFQPVVAQRMGVVADDASVTLDTTRTMVEPSSTSTGTIDLSAGSDRAWKWDDSGAGARIAGGESVGIRLKFSGTFSEAHSFYTFVAELKGGTFGGAVG